MARIQAFEVYTEDYEAWFERHPLIYQSELQAVRKVLPSQGKGIEIGVGSGRFAAPLKIGMVLIPVQKCVHLLQSIQSKFRSARRNLC